MNVVTIVNGMLEENCYLIHNGHDALVIDPGSEGDKIINQIRKNNLNVKGILITHSHFDHIGALDDIKKAFPDAIVIDSKNKGDMSIAMFNFKIIENPGHTKDSVSYYFDKDNILFTGDFIFKGTIGNFSEDMEEAMFKSLNIFKYMSENVKIYPGHGEYTTVLDELKNNPFLRGI